MKPYGPGLLFIWNFFLITDSISLLVIGLFKSTISSLFLVFFFINLFIYLFIYGCVGSSLLCAAFSSCSMQASHCGGFSCCGAWALGTQASVVVARGL